MEVGLDNLERTAKILRCMQLADPAGRLEFVGVDEFELRPDRSAIKLKNVHRQFSGFGAKVRLIPGDVHAALASFANRLGTMDLILLSGGSDDPAELGRAWVYIPRLLHSTSRVLWKARKAGMTGELLPVTRIEIERFARLSRRRAAA